MAVIAAVLAVAMLLVVPPAAGERGTPGERPEFRVLLYTEPDSFHYADVGSVPAAIDAIEALGARHDFGVASRHNPIVFRNEVLRRYDAVIIISPDGDVLDDAQQGAFERFIDRGGGFVGVHGASTAEPGWEFYGELIGARFVSHPPIQPAAVRIVDRHHPSTERLPRPWVRSDEWYEFDHNPRDEVHVLARVDESTYEGGGMGPVHPISWCQRFEGGRSWYTAMGHTVEAYSEPAFRRHLLGGIQWAAAAAHGPCRAGES